MPVVEKNDKVQKDAALSSYKITRRPSGAEDYVPSSNKSTTTQSKPIEATNVLPRAAYKLEP
jgi:hypothetical protein